MPLVIDNWKYQLVCPKLGLKNCVSFRDGFFCRFCHLILVGVGQMSLGTVTWDFNTANFFGCWYFILVRGDFCINIIVVIDIFRKMTHFLFYHLEIALAF